MHIHNRRHVTGTSHEIRTTSPHPQILSILILPHHPSLGLPGRYLDMSTKMYNCFIYCTRVSCLADLFYVRARTYNIAVTHVNSLRFAGIHSGRSLKHEL